MIAGNLGGKKPRGVLYSIQSYFSNLNITHILLLAFLLRIAWMIIAKPVPVSDFEEYRSLASNLIAHHQFGYPNPTAYRLPGYPIFLAFFMLISSSTMWLSIVNVFLSVLIVYFVFVIAWRLTGNKALAILASFIAAVYPIFIFFSPILASEHLFTAILYGGLVLLLSEASAKRLVLTRFFAGILFGAATITRGEAIYYIPIITLLGFFPIIKKVKDRRESRVASTLFSMLVLFLGWIIVILPWYIRNQIVIGPGSGLGTSGGIMFYYGHHDENQNWNDLLSVDNLGTGEVIRSSAAFHKGLSYIFQTPIGVQLRDKVIESLRLYAPNAYPVYWSAAFPSAVDKSILKKSLPGEGLFNSIAIAGYLVVGSSAFLSLFFFKQYSHRFWLTILGFAGMNLLGYAVLFAATSRYRYTIEGFLCILAAITIWQVRMFLTQRKQRQADPTFQ